MSKLVIATRESRLALWQAEHVKALLESRGHEVALLGMTTRGDQILDRSLSKVGGKGLFVKELEVALEQGHADLAVHSLKDVPMELPEGFALACVMEREDPRDAFDQLVGLDAFLFADDVAEDATQQPDVLDEGFLVLPRSARGRCGGGGLGRHGGRRC